MRPYLTILRDAFDEALSSRVLWVLLGLITLILAALAPLAAREEAGWFLNRGEILDRDGFLGQVGQGAKGDRPTPARRIWSRLSSTLQAQLAAPPSGPDADALRWQTARQLRDELNDLLPQRDFFDAQAWQDVKLEGEVRGLLARGVNKLDDEQLARFNRLALEAAFPEQIAAIGSKQIRLYYLGMELASPLAFNRPQLNMAINSVLVMFMVYLLGTAGVLVGILVTSGIVPHTFEPGAIDLLLSKPVSRVLLFLTKFVGSLAFIAINAVYCIVGLWLIAGWRFELWNQKLLLCIPIYLFLFAIYYSVSALAGLVWRNAVLSVVITIVFWLVCASVGTGKGVVEAWALDPLRIARIVPADDTLIVMNERGQTMRWDAAEKLWDPVFHEGTLQRARFGFGQSLIGPVYDPLGQRLLAGSAPGGRFGPIVSGGSLLVGRRSEGWRRVPGIPLPDRTAALAVDAKGKVLALAARGLFRLSGSGQSTRPDVNLFGFKLPIPDAGGRFDQLGPALNLRSPLSAAFDPSTGLAAFYDSRELVLLAPGAEGRYVERARTQIPVEMPGVVAVGSGTVLLALADGRIEDYDPAGLSLRATHRPEPFAAPRFVVGSPEGRYLAVVFHNRRLALWDGVARGFVPVDVAGQGDISAVALGGKGRLWVADHFTRVSEYRIDGWLAAERLSAPMELLERIYHYAIWPLHAVFPKPGQLDQTITYLLTDDDTAVLLRPKEDLAARRLRLDVWGPVWSNLAFLAVVLTISCLYIARKDF